MQPGLVSVVIPVYNGERFLADAVACVRSQNAPVEIIVVNDGSTDNTSVVAAECDGIVYIAQENAGPSAARNRGIEAASGELIAFLDADDLWTPGALSLLCERLRQTPEAGIVQGRMQYVFLEGEHADDMPRRSTQLGTLLVRRRVFEQVGLFDETLRYSEDTDWFMRAVDRGVKVTTIDDVVLLYRIHDRNTTQGRTADELNILQVLRTAIRRRRGER